ncbi:MAG: penicillin-binding protein 2 [Acidimicrobiia bacterium]|nr:penicillin-binding protein 2 [Acidimicrobiia bacterium]
MRRAGHRLAKTELRRQSSRRLAAFVVVAALAFTVVVAKVVDLQAISRDELTGKGDAQRIDRTLIEPRRGDVLDRHGHALAVSVDVSSAYATPRDISDPTGTASKLAPLLGTPEAELRDKLSTDRGFVWLRRKIDDQTAQQIEGLHLEGVGLVPESDRRYPSGTLAASVLGFADIDDKGLAGIEQRFDDQLRGEPGEITIERDPLGRAIPSGERHVDPGRAGRSVQLTIDSALQYESESALAEAVKKYNAKGGVAAVMDPRTGDILAYATAPSFDPNDPGKSDPAARRAWGVGDVFEPGSTSKVITIAGALEDGVVTPDTELSVPDHVQIWDRKLADDEDHPTISMSVREIISQSSNVGTIKVAMALNASRLDEWLRRFGYGTKTGIELPSESRGIYADRKDWSGVSVASFAIGQGVAVTPLQMLRVYGVIANGGMLVEPRIVAGTEGPDGFEPEERPAPVRVVSGQTAASMRGMLTGVVSEGTGAKAAVDGYKVGGKTGTARKPKADGSGYYQDKHVASFIGMAPADDPQVVVMVALDEPDQVYGGLTAAPTFSRIAQFAMRVLRVPPSPQPQQIKGPPHYKGGSSAMETYKPPTPLQIDKRNGVREGSESAASDSGDTSGG